MRWIKYSLLTVFLLLAAYSVSMSFVAETKNFTIEKEINYPVDKVFPQFNNLQNFTSWIAFFAENDRLTFDYFTPYEGQGSSMSFHDQKENDFFGDVFIRYQNQNRTLRYQLFEGKKSNPYLIDVKFIAEGDKTKIIWYIQTPKQPLLKRSLNLLSEDYIADQIDKSMKNLYSNLGNKVDKEKLRQSLKFDSLMVEQQEAVLLLGVNVTTKNDKSAFFKNIVMNHNKVLNFVKMDLAKKNDEYGEPILITDADNFKEKEVSYFYGIPLSKKSGISDNNFSFRTINASKNYVIYYKGNYTGRVNAIQQLLSKAKKDSLRSGDIHQTFLEAPDEEQNTIIKLSLPVYR